MAKPFVFKQFSVRQDKSAMKVGTDGVLLGAWAPIQHNPYAILDIGAGTGLLALMLAQRTSAEIIDAVEIDADAFEECVENFEASPFNDRLFCYHASVEDFADEIDESYDLIVANPPFFTEQVPAKNAQRDVARNTNYLSFNSLIKCASKLLAENGIFCVVIPFKNEHSFLEIANQYNLHPIKITRVKGTPNSPIKRSLIAFSNQTKHLTETELIIEVERHNYTQEYINLTQDFYLKM